MSEGETVAASSSQRSDNDSSSEKGSSSSLEKQKTLHRRESFKKAALVRASDVPPPTSEATKEHSEQGRVQRKVYAQYIAAASRIGFTFFVLSTLGQQVMSVCASLVLRAWGDHNSTTGDNSQVLYYLLRYGLFSLGSVILGAISAVLILMLCSIRSARYLHEAVSRILFLCFLIKDYNAKKKRC
jgi:ATP-binding cassette, subfamily C (CFTR/MRP), member 1